MDELIKHFGTQQALADALTKFTNKPVKQGHIYYWKKKGLPAWRAIEIEKLTNGLFSRHFLCPKYYD